MDVSPKALRDVQFREVRKNGYHPEDVDQFIEEVARGVEGLQDRLRQAVERAQRAESAATEAGGSDETLRRTLVLAQRTADLAVQEAREQASRILAGAEQQAQAVLADTEDRARRTHEEALAVTRSELANLEASRQRAQGEVDGMHRWIDEHRHHLVANLREALSAVERAGAVTPPPASTPVDQGRPPQVPHQQAATSPQPQPSQPGQPQSVPAGAAQAPAEAMGAKATVVARPATGTAQVAAPQAADLRPAATADAWEAPIEEPAPTGEVAVVDDRSGPVLDLGGDELDEADARALDEFFEEGDYSDERRFGGRLRRRR